MISENIMKLRKQKGFSQEEVAEKIGVSRQTIAKWENGDSIPDVVYSSALADLFDVTIDNLVNYHWDEEPISEMPSKGRHIFGTVTVGDKGQIVIPAKARKIFNIKPGDKLMVLGDEKQGLALLDVEFFMECFQQVLKPME